MFCNSKYVLQKPNLLPNWVVTTPQFQDNVKRTMEKGLYTLEDGELIPEPTLSDKGKVETVYLSFYFYILIGRPTS